MLVASEDCFGSTASKETLGAHFPLQKKGLQLASEGKVAIVLVMNDSSTEGAAGDVDLVNSESTESLPFSLLQTLLLDDQRFTKVITFHPAIEKMSLQHKSMSFLVAL